MRTILNLCCSLILVASTAARTNRAPKEIDVHFRLQENVVTLNEPVLIFFEVHNGLKHPVVVTVGALVRQFFDFALKTPSGEVLHKDQIGPGGVALYQDFVTVGDGKVTVEPGGDYKEPLVMNQWFPFATQGVYSLTSNLTSDIETADGTFQAPSQTVQLRVNPRDPVRLAKICAALARRAEAATTVVEAQFPSLALSYVTDPIAIPYLARLLSAHTLVYNPAVSGLERIGNDEAAEALLSAMNENWGDIPELATRSLARMQDRIANPHLKETVKKAVERSSERARNEFIKTQIAYLDYRSPSLQQTAIQSLMKVEG